MKTDQLRRLLREISIISERAEDRLAERLPAGLQRGQFALLNHLYFTTNRDETPSDLATLHGVTRSAMTQMLTRLRQQQLIDLRPSAHDGRSRLVALTAIGRKRMEDVFAALEPDLQALAAPRSMAQLQSLLEGVGALRRDMEALVPRGPETLPVRSTHS